MDTIFNFEKRRERISNIFVFVRNVFSSNIENEKIRILEISNLATIDNNLSLIENCFYFTQGKIPEEEIILSLEQYGVNHFKDDLVQNFSSGMIKRSEMAIAQIIDPDILCIDEPLNYLDKQGVELLKILLAERSKVGKGNILSSQESINIFENNYEMIDLNVY